MQTSRSIIEAAMMSDISHSSQTDPRSLVVRRSLSFEMILADQIESSVPNRNGYVGERCRRLFQMKTQSNISGKTREQEPVERIESTCDCDLSIKKEQARFEYV